MNNKFVRIKWVLAGIGSILLGTIGLLGAIQKLATCAVIKSGKFADFTWLRPNDVCEFPNYSDGTLGVLLIIGIVLVIAGIKKKPLQSTDQIKQK